MENHHEKNNQNHHHHHSEEVATANKSRLIFVILLNLLIALAEVLGGIFSGSLSLTSDALHNASDTVSIVLSYVSLRVSEKPKSKTNTYGYKRANILSAFVNSAALIGISLFLVIEAIRKFFEPQKVNGNAVIIVAVIGLLGNLFSTLLLKKGSESSLNIKSSFLHMLSDTLSSVAVIIAGIVIKFFAVYWIDPVLTILLNIVIVKSSFSVLKESISILMQSAPVNVNMDELEKELLTFDEIKGVHHLHVWELDENTILLESHVQVQDMLLSSTKEISEKVEKALHDRFEISHIVLQFESDDCSNESCKL